MLQRVVVMVVLAVCAALPAGAESQWIPIVAHQPGFESTYWRSDVAVLNGCDDTVTVTLVLRSGEEEISESFAVAGGRQQTFEDVVAQLTTEETAGSLEIRSAAPLSVSARTFNQGGGGTFGQHFDGLGADAAMAVGDTVLLQQLRQDGAFRTNIGVLNMGAQPAAVELTLFDRLGGEVGSFELQPDPGRTVLDTRSFLDRFGRDDVFGGYATAEALSGDAVWVYASVIDQITGDPTTVTPKPLAECPVDIADRLAAIPGLTVVESSSPSSAYRYFVLSFEQPADHDDPAGEGFTQYMTLLHRDAEAPMVMYTAGYDNWVGRHQVELTWMLGANQLAVEHRFFDSSTPASRDWSLLSIEQAAADHHRVVEALKPLYRGAWINTGFSKGGMTAVYHRRFYPDDVDATVAYVAPVSFAAPDPRYVDFVATRGEPWCRDALTALQREALGRGGTMVPMLESWASSRGYRYQRIGGAEAAFEAAVVELPFTFWQYSGDTHCDNIPGIGASDTAIFNALSGYSSFWYPSDSAFEHYAAYFYQAHSELGYPELGTSEVADLLATDVLNLEAGLPPVGSNPVYDGGSAMRDVADWVARQGSRLLFVYGENDPWTAGAFELGDAEDSFVFTDPGGTHGASLSTLTTADHQAAMDALQRWTGVTPLKRVPRAPHELAATRGRRR